MNKFNYDDVVRVKDGADEALRPGKTAWVIGVFSDRPPGKHFQEFPPGTVYSIEFEDGDAIDVHEDNLELHVSGEV